MVRVLDPLIDHNDLVVALEAMLQIVALADPEALDQVAGQAYECPCGRYVDTVAAV
jgi:hypothetical protein